MLGDTELFIVFFPQDPKSCNACSNPECSDYVFMSNEQVARTSLLSPHLGPSMSLFETAIYLN